MSSLSDQLIAEKVKNKELNLKLIEFQSKYLAMSYTIESLKES